MEEPKRIFIVGIARSGTTLLQSLIGSHSEVFTLPETHFWDKTLYKQSYLRFFQIIGSKEFKIISDYLTKIGYKVPEFLKSNKKFFSKKLWTRSLINIIDEITAKDNKLVWVEKTPLNIYYIDLIGSTFPNTYFIHLIRNPLDNIASLYDASLKHPDFFVNNSIENAVNRYIKEISISKKYIGTKNHFFLRYEHLILDPKKTLIKLCDNLKINFENDMLNYHSTANNVIFKEEEWKRNNVLDIKKSNKAQQIFNENQRNYILKRTASINLNIFDFG